ncbi:MULTISPECIES: putative quinol monooxygenase [unclassified Duganella]|uniref:putative quinol monooxygenase n=1 Tax=unclassified Duganella TaxID=2636909 RepID=UPI00088B006B|nr:MULTISPECIES: putative quinol monooxygenase [unclassified Duganella]SDG03569.1 Quinol monooxygenase YgiN [Duganella sp. OV458]SDJ01753.1 Quinol monooxygenase YgiN [Duganella sp. OV510]
MKELIVVATITAKEGNEVLVREALEKIVPPSRAEAGCIRYDLHIDLGNHASFVMLEAWRDEAVLAAHEATPHFQQLVSSIAGKADVQIIKLNQVL